ncbi:MAG: CRISPR-associated protein Cas4 [Anaerolineae bacterium]|nr:CRISPR-associated protein Cas4 [Anaerolineae bacterium]
MMVLAALSLVLAGLFFWFASRRQQAAGLPAGRVIYVDSSEWGAVEKPLYDALLGLAGKPDYVVKKGKAMIPVEVKTGRTPDIPYDAHIYQLAAYCLLVERTYGARPGYGILHYPKRTFAVDFTHALETALLELLVKMRAMDAKRSVMRSHDEPQRCNRCGYQSDCEQRI